MRNVADANGPNDSVLFRKHISVPPDLHFAIASTTHGTGLGGWRWSRTGGADVVEDAIPVRAMMSPRRTAWERQGGSAPLICGEGPMDKTHG